MRTRSSTILANELEALKESKKKINKAMLQAARRQRRVSQRAGSLILEVPLALRERVLGVFDAIVADEDTLRACEAILEFVEAEGPAKALQLVKTALQAAEDEIPLRAEAAE